MRTSSGQAAQQRVRPKAKLAGSRWATAAPRSGRPQSCAVGGAVVHGRTRDFRYGVTAAAWTGPGTRFMFSGAAACSACTFDDPPEQRGAGLVELLCGLQVSQCAGALAQFFKRDV